MVDYETFCRIRDHLVRQQLTVAQTSRALGLDVRTVARWAEVEQFRARRAVPRTSKLDAFKGQIVRWLDAHPYSAQQIYQRLAEAGYAGGITIVKDYVQRIRPRRQPAFLKLDFEPGECAQVDWGSYGTVNVGNTSRRLSFFLMVLCYCRRMYLEFTVSQEMEFFLACHENAFAAFGGVPARLMVDNLKSAVLKRLVGAAPVFNPKYLDSSRHWGFEIGASRSAPATSPRVGRRVGSRMVLASSRRTSSPAASSSTSPPCSPPPSCGWTRWPTCACTAPRSVGPSICSRKNAPTSSGSTPPGSTSHACARQASTSSSASRWTPIPTPCPRATWASA